MLKDSKVYLAPLEGLADGPMREVLCAHGGYDLCFSEFIRITDLCVSEKTLIREIPEFLNDCKTPDGTDLRVQFLGDNPKTLSKIHRYQFRLSFKICSSLWRYALKGA